MSQSSSSSQSTSSPFPGRRPYQGLIRGSQQNPRLPTLFSSCIRQAQPITKQEFFNDLQQILLTNNVHLESLIVCKVPQPGEINDEDLFAPSIKTNGYDLVCLIKLGVPRQTIFIDAAVKVVVPQKIVITTKCESRATFLKKWCQVDINPKRLNCDLSELPFASRFHQHMVLNYRTPQPFPIHDPLVASHTPQLNFMKEWWSHYIEKLDEKAQAQRTVYPPNRSCSYSKIFENWITRAERPPLTQKQQALKTAQLALHELTNPEPNASPLSSLPQEYKDLNGIYL
ncbi:unnamed protein product, partial [Didymodactylos carnosus]